MYLILSFPLKSFTHLSEHNTEYFYKKLFKYNARIDGPSMQEVTTYLAHY